MEQGEDQAGPQDGQLPAPAAAPRVRPQPLGPPEGGAGSTATPGRCSRCLADQEGHVEGEDWQGLTVRARDGRPLGLVVGVFAAGPLAGRLRVHGAYVPSPRETARPAGTAVYAIPHHAVVSCGNGSLWLGVTPGKARTRWLMHIVPSQKA